MLPERDMIEDTRRIKKITPAKYNAHVNVRAASAHVMQRSCFSTPTDPSIPFLFGTTAPSFVESTHVLNAFYITFPNAV